MAVIINELATTVSGAVCLCAAGCLVFGVCLGLKIEVGTGGGVGVASARLLRR